MAKQVDGVTQRLLDCAKNEFLHKGYKDSSLRIIAKNAKTSTGSIYTRFGDKQGLFNAIVKSAAQNFENKYREQIEIFNTMSPMNWNKMLEYTNRQHSVLVDIIYDDFAAFKLLVCHAAGTVFSDFIHNIVEIEVSYTIKYFEGIGNDAIKSKRVTPELLHLLCSAYWSGIFEIVVHDMDKGDATAYIQQLLRFFECGWSDIFSSY